MPKRIAEEDHVGLTCFGFFSNESAAEYRLNSESGQDVYAAHDVIDQLSSRRRINDAHGICGQSYLRRLAGHLSPALDRVIRRLLVLNAVGIDSHRLIKSLRIWKRQ